MNILKNKHLMTAALVAPILAILSYYAIDAWVGESPHAARAGQSYQLVEKPNCRYGSGLCGLKNGDFELELNTERLDDARSLLKLKSVFPLDGVKVALSVNGTEEQQPTGMRPAGDDGLSWSLEIARPNPGRDRLHLVAAASQSFYYGDVATKFTESGDRPQD